MQTTNYTGLDRVVDCSHVIRMEIEYETTSTRSHRGNLSKVAQPIPLSRKCILDHTQNDTNIPTKS